MTPEQTADKIVEDWLAEVDRNNAIDWDDLADLKARIAKATDPGTCHWKDDGEGNWSTDCDNCFIIMEGNPEENDMLFCSYCGKTLVATCPDLWLDEEDETEKESKK